MTTKTPEQIAFNLAQEWRGHRDHIVFTERTLIGALREAIEADRAQRFDPAEHERIVDTIIHRRGALIGVDGMPPNANAARVAVSEAARMGMLGSADA